MKKITLVILALVFAAPNAHSTSEARRKIRSWAKKMDGVQTMTASMGNAPAKSQKVAPTASPSLSIAPVEAATPKAQDSAK